MTTTHRYQAYFVVEAESAFAIGSGEKGFTVDRLIARDALGLPYLPGSSLAGVLRHELETGDSTDRINELFGFQGQNSSGQGSRLIVSSGHLIGEDGKTVIEGLQPIDLQNGYYSYFQRLPERDHVRMTDRGAADTANHGKFDEEVVHKGTRFAFRLELMGSPEDHSDWEQMLSLIHQPMFRIGAGTRKGFGKFSVISCETRTLNLQEAGDLTAYLEADSSLNISRSGWTPFNASKAVSKEWKHYQLELTPENFFLFAAGYGDKEVDNKPKTESYFSWKNQVPVLLEQDSFFLIPATSIKGALSHRLAYHYNLHTNTKVGGETEVAQLPSLNQEALLASLDVPVQIDTLALPSDSEEWKSLEAKIQNMTLEDSLKSSVVWQDYSNDLEDYQAAVKHDEHRPHVGEANEAVRQFFGYANDRDGSGARGNVILSDIYLPRQESDEKVLSHVSIDRFTGGARDGMLFQQKVASSGSFTLDIYVKGAVLENESLKTVFEKTLQDLCKGDLPLGGSTTKGHGVFHGTCTPTLTQSHE